MFCVGEKQSRESSHSHLLPIKPIVSMPHYHHYHQAGILNLSFIRAVSVIATLTVSISHHTASAHKGVLLEDDCEGLRVDSFPQISVSCWRGEKEEVGV